MRIDLSDFSSLSDFLKFSDFSVLQRLIKDFNLKSKLKFALSLF